jgi:glyoxylase-like metal-dependent hydrolase (beta-lactamase superfamily II)/ferredoxin
MARLQERRTENVRGNFYVDQTCIDCDTCRWIAPEFFTKIEGKSALYQQPQNETEIIKATQALLSCPTASIGTVEKIAQMKSIQETLPILVADNVYHCGYHSQLSFAAASYLIVRKEGNILIDSPRFAAPLVKRITEMGGVKYMYLTHKDDIADHEKYQEHFGCDRLLHTDDINSKTEKVEIKLTGNDPIELTEELLIIPVPGHTKGHTVLLYKNKYLFTGDHLAADREEQKLTAFRNFCWYSWPEQIKSMEKLVNYEFEWILPGHGRRYHQEPERMQEQLKECIEWMKTV